MTRGKYANRTVHTRLAEAEAEIERLAQALAAEKERSHRLESEVYTTDALRLEVGRLTKQLDESGFEKLRQDAKRARAAENEAFKSFEEACSDVWRLADHMGALLGWGKVDIENAVRRVCDTVMPPEDAISVRPGVQKKGLSREQAEPIQRARGLAKDRSSSGE